MPSAYDWESGGNESIGPQVHNTRIDTALVFSEGVIRDPETARDQMKVKYICKQI